MKENIIKIIIISVVLIINIILVIFLVSSVNSYINKIKNGEIQQIAENDSEEYADLNFTEIIKKVFASLTLNDIIQIVLLIVGLILMVLEVIIYIKVLKYRNL